MRIAVDTSVLIAGTSGAPEARLAARDVMRQASEVYVPSIAWAEYIERAVTSGPEIFDGVTPIVEAVDMFDARLAAVVLASYRKAKGVCPECLVPTGENLVCVTCERGRSKKSRLADALIVACADRLKVGLDRARS